MNIKKVNAGVWVKASEELPKEKEFVFIQNNKDMQYVMYHKDVAWYDEDGDCYLYDTDTDNNKIEWLKPVEGYVLSEDELQNEFIKILVWYSKQGDDYRSKTLLIDCVKDYYKKNFIQ